MYPNSRPRPAEDQVHRADQRDSKRFKGSKIFRRHTFGQIWSEREPVIACVIAGNRTERASDIRSEGGKDSLEGLLVRRVVFRRSEENVKKNYSIVIKEYLESRTRLQHTTDVVSGVHCYLKYRARSAEEDFMVKTLALKH